MKILYITTIGTTMGFFRDLIKSLIDKGHIIDIATNENEEKVPECYREWGCRVFPVSCTRSPFNKGTIIAIKQIRKLVEENNYDIVHCHTPIAAVCTRIACRKLRNIGIKVIYTAHGFHFYKGAPAVNWLIYYPVEWVCSFWTDVLITITKEDFERAKKHLHALKTEYVPGVGIDTYRFANTAVDIDAKRKEIGVSSDDFLILSVGELNSNKNHEQVIRALPQLKNTTHYAIAGAGDLKEYLLNLASELNVSDRVHLLGFRTDVAELYKAADIFVLPSYREGLNVSMMEALASGLPVVCRAIRGNVDLISDGINGRTFTGEDLIESLNAAKEIVINKAAMNNCIEQFDIKNINEQVINIYNSVLR